MKKILLPVLLALLPTLAFGQTFREWQDPKVNEINRLPMRSRFFTYSNHAEADRGDMINTRRVVSLHGDWKFYGVENAENYPTDFYKTNYDDSQWRTMPIPGLWELNGFGDPVYLNVGYAWRGHFKNQPMADNPTPVKDNRVGSYRRVIEVPADWKGQPITLYIGSVTSNAYVWVNGRFVGYTEDSKLEAEFDVTKYIKPGQKNLIAFRVFRWCDGSYLEDQDFFRLSGFARDTYLYTRPNARISDLRVTQTLENDYKDGMMRLEFETVGTPSIKMFLYDQDQKIVWEHEMKGQKSNKVTARLANVAPWSAENPNLYKLVIETYKSGQLSEVIPMNIGFRKIEMKDGQLLFNGKAILFKGANRHEMTPEHGYIISREEMERDVKIFKELNMNAVRTCHYPDDPYFYDLCDRYGLYMVSEANIESHGMGYGPESLAKQQLWQTAHVERNLRHVSSRGIHPSVVMWSMSNEAGDGINFTAARREILKLDTSRPILLEQAHGGDNTDVTCPMYASPDWITKYAESNPRKPLILIEYAHAMGNSLGGFKEYMDLFHKYDALQGGFIWDFVDQAIYSKSKDGKRFFSYGGDYNDYDPSDDNFCVNGLIAPDRRYNPHAYEAQHRHQFIMTSLVKEGDKNFIRIYNDNYFEPLKDIRLEWEYVVDGDKLFEYAIDCPAVAPQSHQDISIILPPVDINKDAFVNVYYKYTENQPLLPKGWVVAKDQLVVNEKKLELPPFATSGVVTLDDSHSQTLCFVVNRDIEISFDRSTGFMNTYSVAGKSYITPGTQMKPEFYRAPTDNDMGANLQNKWSAWRQPEYKLDNLDYYIGASGRGYVRADYTMPASNAKLTLTYTIDRDGKIYYSQKMTKGDKKVLMMFRYGFKLQMPKSFDKVHYYGRGPIENYIDRKSNSMIGKYTQTVAEQFYPYVRPQENGLKADNRYWMVIDRNGDGLGFISDNPFYASTLEYSLESLDEYPQKSNRHSELIEKDATSNHVHLDFLHMGLGTINSWGALPYEKYRLPYDDYGYTMVIYPVANVR